MNSFDIGICATALLAALVLLVRSPFHRAIISEALFHPRSQGWVDCVDGKVVVHRENSLHDEVLKKAILAIEETQAALEAASRDLQSEKPTGGQSPENSSWWIAAGTTAALAIGFLTSQLLGGSDVSHKGAA